MFYINQGLCSADTSCEDQVVPKAFRVTEFRSAAGMSWLVGADVMSYVEGCLWRLGGASWEGV